MAVSDKILSTIERVAVLHQGQYRKDNVTPFVAHPFAVGFLLSQYTDDEDIILAGLLHDVLEDVEEYTKEDMKKEFGDSVTKIVESVTHNDSLGWKERSIDYLQKIQSSEKSLMVSCADKIHNLRSSIEGVEKMGESFWDAFSAQKKDYQWFYTSVLEIARRDLNNPIVDELQRVLDEAKQETFR